MMQSNTTYLKSSHRISSKGYLELTLMASFHAPAPNQNSPSSASSFGSMIAFVSSDGSITFLVVGFISSDSFDPFESSSEDLESSSEGSESSSEDLEGLDLDLVSSVSSACSHSGERSGLPLLE